MNKKPALGALLAVLLFAAACAPVNTPIPGPAPSPDASPTAKVAVAAPTLAVASATAAPSAAATLAGKGATFAGTVRYAGQPLAGASVELRPLGWAATGAPAVAATTAGADGTFTLSNPPVGDWSVVGIFPDGEVDAGGWPPVSIGEGQGVLGFVVPLERKLALLSPLSEAAAPALPVFAWQPAPDAAAYRVWVIDAGTTELMVDQVTGATTLAVPVALKPGAYQWVVTATSAAGEAVATGSDTFTVAGAASATPALPAAPGDANGLPPPCQPVQGEFAAFGDEQRGFCFRYPEKFQAVIPEGTIDAVGSVVGPALDASPDPLRATLMIVAVPAAGQDLKTATQDVLNEFKGMPGVSIRQRPFDLGGVPAVLLEGVPGRGGSRDIVAVQNGYRLRLLFMPDPSGFPQVKSDLEALFDSVTESFTFMTVPGAQG